VADFTPLKGTVKARDFLVLDIESKDGPGQKAGFTRPFMVGVYDGKTFVPFFDQDNSGTWDQRYYKPGGCVDLAMRYICQKKYRNYHVYAHNGGRFDHLFLLPWLMDEGEKRGFKFSIIPVASSIQMLDVWRGEKWNKWRFLDSYKLIPTSLDKAAKSFGLPGKLKHDLHLHENDPGWIDYNKQDCVELYNVVERFHHYVETVLGGEVGITAPSTSIKLLRRKYLNAPIPRSEDTHEFVRASYFGGRVEVFKRAGEGLSYFDINSSYPACMLEPMPGGHAAWWEGEPPKRFKERRIGFAEVEVTVPEDLVIPPLPMRGNKDNGLPDGKLVFPTGHLRGIWEWSELQLAMEVGCTIDVWHKSVWYEQVSLFEGFVTDLYKYRNKNHEDYDEGLAGVVKIMLNSCYGKFGQKTLRKKIYRHDDPELPEDAVPATGEPNSPIWYAEEETDAAYIMPQIAARVTALGRVKLYRYMMEAQKAGGNVYYCDTDSIITDVREGIETTTELGGLKDEYPEQSGNLSGRFLGPKLYLLTDDSTNFERVAAKGLQNRSRNVFEDFASGKTITMERLEKVGTLAREGFSRGPRVRKIPRTHRSETLGKRVMKEDGSTVAYNIDMREE
jgi:hypothetical protein